MINITVNENINFQEICRHVKTENVSRRQRNT